MNNWWLKIYYLFADGFFLCRTQQHVYETTIKFTIQWLEVDPVDAMLFHVAYLDTIHQHTVITDVKLQRVEKDAYTLPPAQKTKIETNLLKSIRGHSTEDDGEDNGKDDAEDGEQCRFG